MSFRQQAGAESGDHRAVVRAQVQRRKHAVELAEDRVVGTFQFRANKRASNAPPAPDGSTFALVTEGIIDLQYR